MALEKSVKNNKYVHKMVKYQIWLTRIEENEIFVKKWKNMKKVLDFKEWTCYIIWATNKRGCEMIFEN